jgi:hypothetical protein
MPSLFTIIMDLPLTLKLTPFALIGVVLFCVSFLIRPVRLRIALLVFGLILFFPLLMFLVLFHFSNM